MIAGALTAAEIAYLRTSGQHSQLYLAFPAAATIFARRVNQTFTTTDKVVEIIYDDPDGGAGVYTDILPGMTCWVGSAPLGYDLGQCRVRKAATATVLYVGENSDIAWADDLYLTVVDEFNIWPRHLYINPSKVVYMDYDIPYGTQHTAFAPVPVLGPDRVLFYKGVLGGGNTISAYPDASASWCLAAGGKSYIWLAPGRSAESGMTSATPTITYNATGTYRVSCQVSVGGVATIGYRTIMVYDSTHLPVTQFQLRNCAGSWQRGGWEFSVELYAECALSVVRERAKCILFARDWYGDTTNLTSTAISFEASSHKIKKASGLDVFTTGMTIQVSGSTSNNGLYTIATGGVSSYIVVNEALTDESAAASVTLQTVNGQTETSIGPVVGSENVIASGWIAEENLTLDPVTKRVAFTVQGPQYWLSQIPGFPVGLEDKTTTPAAWTSMNTLTVDKAIWHLLYWRSTAMNVIDVILSSDTRRAKVLEAPVGNLWTQITTIAELSILAHPACDRYGRLYVQIDSQFLPSRAGIPIVMDVAKQDRKRTVLALRRPAPPVSQLNLSGVYWSGTSGTAFFSLANGHVFKRVGQIDVLDRLLLSTQAQSNTLAGLVLGNRNNIYPDFEIPLAANNRAIDICPYQYLTVAIVAGDNPRGVTFSGNIIPREVAITRDQRTGFLSTTIHGEAETFAEIAVTGDTPVNPPPAPPFPPLPPLPPWPPVPTNGIQFVVIADTLNGIWYTDKLEFGSTQWWSMNGGDITGRYAGINDIFISRTGLLYALYKTTFPAGPDYSGVYMGALGSGMMAWKLTQAWLLGQFTPFTPTPGYGIAIGFIDMALKGNSNTMLLEAGKRDFTDMGIYPFVGTIDALVKNNLPLVVGVNGGGAMSYGSAGWHWVIAGGYSCTLNAAGTAFTKLRIADLFSLYNLNMVRGSTSGSPIDVWGTTPAKISQSTDGGATYNSLSVDVSQGRARLAADPTGQYMMYVVSGGALKRSSDSGAVWGDVSALSAYHVDTILNAGDGNKWVAIVYEIGVFYSSDFGDTWEDHTGNLADFILLGSPHPNLTLRDSKLVLG